MRLVAGRENWHDVEMAASGLALEPSEQIDSIGLYSFERIKMNILKVVRHVIDAGVFFINTVPGLRLQDQYQFLRQRYCRVDSLPFYVCCFRVDV